MHLFKFPRRAFLASLGSTLCTPLFCGWGETQSQAGSLYRGPNVIIVRFGGGVRRRETIDKNHTFAPFLCRRLVPQGTLFKNMEISHIDGVETSHSQGTLHILTGGYKTYRKIEKPGFGENFEATVPKLFEYIRKSFSIPSHQILLVNNENRAQEEFLSFSDHQSFGVHYQSEVLSWFRFKYYFLNEQL